MHSLSHEHAFVTYAPYVCSNTPLVMHSLSMTFALYDLSNTPLHVFLFDRNLSSCVHGGVVSLDASPHFPCLRLVLVLVMMFWVNGSSDSRAASRYELYFGSAPLRVCEGFTAFPIPAQAYFLRYLAPAKFSKRHTLQRYTVLSAQ